VSFDSGLRQEVSVEPQLFVGSLPTTLRFPIEIANCSPEPTSIVSVDVTCGCSVPTIPTGEIAIGQSFAGNVKITTDRFQQHAQKTATIKLQGGREIAVGMPYTIFPRLCFEANSTSIELKPERSGGLHAKVLVSAYRLLPAAQVGLRVRNADVESSKDVVAEIDAKSTKSIVADGRVCKYVYEMHVRTASNDTKINNILNLELFDLSGRLIDNIATVVRSKPASGFVVSPSYVHLTPGVPRRVIVRSDKDRPIESARLLVESDSILATFVADKSSERIAIFDVTAASLTKQPSAIVVGKVEINGQSVPNAVTFVVSR